MDVRSPVGRAVLSRRVGEMVAAAVGDYAVALGEARQQDVPKTVILESAMDEHNRFSLADLDISKLGIADGNLPDFLGRGSRAHRHGKGEKDEQLVETSNHDYPPFRPVFAVHATSRVASLTLRILHSFLQQIEGDG